MKTRLLTCLFCAGFMLFSSCGEDLAECSSQTCPDGCCDGDTCMRQSPGSCGIGGLACVDCLSDAQSDTCSAGVCICEAEGLRCGNGQACTSTGCTGECIPDCTGKCPDADDGCEGNCLANDCAGCCDGTTCRDSSATSCGTGGGDCVDCTANVRSDSCSAGVCECAATGSLCVEGEECALTGCEGCSPDCTGKCQGAEDGCESTCPSNNCTSGCCTGAHECILYASQSDSVCGKDGGICVDCEIMAEVCGLAFTCREANINDARFVAQTVPAVMDPSEVLEVSVTFENIGTTDWTDAAGHRLGAENPRDNSNWGNNRASLDGADNIRPGESKTFTFQITAPSVAGTYAFQWRMLQEAVEWFGEFGTSASITVGTVNACEAIRSLAGTNTDASVAIQSCIDNTPSGETLELPAGIYRMDHQVQISARPITLRSEGKNESMPKCATDNHDCAELKASTSFADTIGILRMLSPGTRVDHIVVNGNKVERRSTASGQSCSAGSNQYGYNIQMGCNDCGLTNSVTKNALCGTGAEVSGVRSNIRVWRNTIAFNGVHNLQGLWADGLTVHDAQNSTFTENEAVDNTDIDIIFGGCTDCAIQNNTIWHTAAFEGSTFAGLMIHAWTTTSGNYTGTVTSGNAIDCGPQRQCGIGLYIGSDAWYDTDTFGGSVHDNTVANAQFGLLIDDARNMEVYNNPVTNSGTTTMASCGLKNTHDYGIGQDSVNIDTSLDTRNTIYQSVDFDFCIPNWWNQ